MRSIFLVLSACGAVSHASECQASEETSLLQGRSLVRLTTDAKTSLKSSLTEGSDAKSLDAHGLVKSLQNLAHKVGTISDEEVNRALAEAADALATLSPAIQEEIQALQHTIRDAAAAVQACHAESGVAQRAGLWEAAEAQAAEVTTCEAELATAVADEERICSEASIEDVQSECACNEARVRREDKHELCEALTTAYENAYCEHNLQCNTYHDCHEGEVVVYNQIRADVEAAMGPITQEYIAAEQSTCIMEIIQHSMMNGVPIDFAAVLACSNVDTSSLLLVYPDLPAAPGACPAATTGSPGCGGAAALNAPAWTMSSNVVRTGNMFSKPAGTNTYDAWALKDGMTEITIRKPMTSGHVRLGLTTDPSDNHGYPHGRYVGLFPNGRMYLPPFADSTYTVNDVIKVKLEGRRLSLLKNGVNMATWDDDVAALSLYAKLHFYEPTMSMELM